MPCWDDGCVCIYECGTCEARVGEVGVFCAGADPVCVGDGCRLLTSSADRTARCLWLPVGKHAGAGTTFVGHGGPVLSVSWSHTGEHLLTSSADR